MQPGNSKKHERYKRYFDKRFSASTVDIVNGSNVLVRNEFWRERDKKHKLAKIADGPYKVISTHPDENLNLGQSLGGAGIPIYGRPVTQSQRDDSE